ncbi:cobalt transporter CbiM, partial [Edwardsiella tarda]
MHISEGILTLPVILSGWGGSALLATLTLRRTTAQQLPRIAVLSSAFFLASLVRIPLGASSVHFTLLGVMGIILGWSAFPAIFIALALQAILFQFGGLLSLGVNASIMGGAALLGCLPLRAGLR